MKLLYIPLAGLVFAASACAGAKVRYVKPDFNAPDIVSVLPPDNESLDLTAPRAVMSAVSSALIGMGYFPILTPAQEETLKGIGLTDGGQLRAYQLNDLADKLGVDGLAVTTIHDFKKVNIGFYISPLVDCTVALYDRAGEKLWESNAKYTEKKISLSVADAIAAGVGELAGDMVGKMFKTHLVLESQRMGGLLVQTADKNAPSLSYPGPGYTARKQP